MTELATERHARAASPALPSSRPSRARHVTVAFCVVLALITYIDRVAISQAAPFISQDLGLSRVELGWALAIFGYAYAAFEIPGGWLADRIGPRKVLMRIVLWWSTFTAATGWAAGATSLILVRGLFGAGEAGAFPSITRTLTGWLPKGERERAQAFVWLATRLSAALTPTLVLWLIVTVSWRRAFEIFGVLGVVWAVVFYRWFRDDPSEHPSVNRAELALLPSASERRVAHRGVPWRQLFSHRAVWLLSIQYMCVAYGWWFYVNWLPTYLREARGTSFQLGAVLAGLPLLFGGIGCLVSAAVLPRLARRVGSVMLARRIVAIVGFVGASASIFTFTAIAEPVRAMFVLGLAGFFNDLIMPPAWAGTMDVGGRYAGTVSGAMNTMGSIAGAFSVTFVGYLLTWTGDNWTATFLVSASIYLAGAICWLFLDAETPIDGI
ncbi:MAG: MFS transporter [Acidobacteria bacterium]|nr:MFS transporter [Acidobacteriota bacterium]